MTVFKLMIGRGRNGQAVKCLIFKGVGLREVNVFIKYDLVNKDGLKITYREGKGRMLVLCANLKGWI